MSKNKPNWADKANVALNTVQVAQLHQVHKTLKVMGALQAEKAQVVANEYQAKERENALRESIWVLEKNFGGVMGDPKITPAAIILIVQELHDFLDRLGVTTASFTQFSDKDRLGAFLNRAQQASRDATARMTAAQAMEFENYKRYLSEDQELNDHIIELQVGRIDRADELADAERQREAAIRELSHIRDLANDPIAQNQFSRCTKQRRIAAMIKPVLIIPAILAWFLSFGLILPLVKSGANGPDHNDTVLIQIGIPALLTAIICTALYFHLNSFSRPAKPLGAQITEAEEKIETAEAEVARLRIARDAPREAEIFTRFQVKDVSELIHLRQQRDEFLRRFEQANYSYRRIVSSAKKMRSPSKYVLSPEVQALARQAHGKILAIRLHHQQTGVSVPQAQEDVEAFLFEEEL